MHVCDKLIMFNKQIYKKNYEAKFDIIIIVKYI